MTQPRFAMITEAQFAELKSAAQLAIVAEVHASPYGRTDCNWGSNVRTRWRYVRAAKEEYWNGRAKKAAGKARVLEPTQSKANGRAITAAECNAWLSQLPPIPLYGEEQ